MPIYAGKYAIANFAEKYCNMRQSHIHIKLTCLMPIYYRLKERLFHCRGPAWMLTYQNSCLSVLLMCVWCVQFHSVFLLQSDVLEAVNFCVVLTVFVTFNTLHCFI